MELDQIYNYKNGKIIGSNMIENTNPKSGILYSFEPNLYKQGNFYIYDDFTYQIIAYHYLNKILPIVATKFYINPRIPNGVVNHMTSNIHLLKDEIDNTVVTNINLLTSHPEDSLTFNIKSKQNFSTIMINTNLTKQMFKELRNLIKQCEYYEVNSYFPTIDDFVWTDEPRYIPKAVFTIQNKRIMPILNILAPMKLDNYFLPSSFEEYYIFDNKYSFSQYQLLVSSGLKMYHSMDFYYILISLLLLPEFFYSFFSDQELKEYWINHFNDDLYQKIKNIHLAKRTLHNNKEEIFNLLRNRKLLHDY